VKAARDAAKELLCRSAAQTKKYLERVTANPDIEFLGGWNETSGAVPAMPPNETGGTAHASPAAGLQSPEQLRRNRASSGYS
jgi:hypothetical protein